MSSSNLHETIIDMVSKRGKGSSICPSEVARHLWPNEWRDKMEEVRFAATELARTNEISITQGGVPVDLEAIKGPIRLTIKKHK